MWESDDHSALAERRAAEEDIADMTADRQLPDIYAVDPSGKMFVADAEADQDVLNAVRAGEPYEFVQHSSISEGRPVAGAGQLLTDRDGVLQALSNQTGHYGEFRYGNPDMQQTIDTLEGMEVDLDNTVINLVRTHDPAQYAMTIPAVNATVAEFEEAEGDQELLYTLQLSAQESWDDRPRPSDSNLLLNAMNGPASYSNELLDAMNDPASTSDEPLADMSLEHE
jgi:hypothetical protein